MYVGDRRSQIFHLITCQYANEISSHNKVNFMSRSEALNLNYRPCEVCNP